MRSSQSKTSIMMNTRSRKKEVSKKILETPKETNNNVNVTSCSVDLTPINDIPHVRSTSHRPAARVLKELQNQQENVSEDSCTTGAETEDRLSDQFSTLSDTSDEEENESLQNILKRQSKLKEKKHELVKKLAIVEMTQEIRQTINRQNNIATPKRGRPIYRLTKKQPAPPPRKSQRLLRKDPQGVDLPPEPVEVEINPRKPEDEFKMEAVGFEPLSADEEVPNKKLFEKSMADYEEFMRNVSKVMHLPDIIQDISPALQSYQKILQRMKITPDHVQKIVKGRIFSLAIHPSKENTLIAAGDKYGRLGLWNVTKQDSNGGAYEFSPHIKPISCLKFSQNCGSKLFMCSYDGQLRTMDLQKLVFEQTIVNDEDAEMSGFDFLHSEDCLVTSCTNGDVQILDLRAGKIEKQSRFEAHHRAAKCVSVHPVDKNYVVTSSRDSSVHIFDLRKVSYSGKQSTPVVTLPQHTRSVSSAYFSPINGNFLLTTSYDDRLRLFDTSTITSEKVSLVSNRHHNNQTGRWLSSFRACWHPSRDDTFVVGCMEYPRRIELFDPNGQHLHVLSEPEVLTTICSTNCIHPTQNVIAGGNSSGKVFVFTE